MQVKRVKQGPCPLQAQAGRERAANLNTPDAVVSSDRTDSTPCIKDGHQLTPSAMSSLSIRLLEPRALAGICRRRLGSGSESMVRLCAGLDATGACCFSANVSAEKSKVCARLVGADCCACWD